MLTKKMQYQAIVNRLAGIDSNPNPTLEDFDQPLRRCWLALENAPSGQGPHALFQALDSDADRLELLHMLRTLVPGVELGVLPSLHELSNSTHPINWIWKGWLPRGMISMLAAAPGSGKSLVALDLCRRLIERTTFPDGQPVESDNPRIIYVDGESALPLHFQRAQAWGMDTRTLFMKLPTRLQAIDLSDTQQRDVLCDEVARNRPELVVIDSFGNISSRGENDVKDVRDLMNFLTWLCRDYQVGLLLIHHTRKGLAMRGRPAEFSMDEVRGSGHLLAATRSLLGLNIVQTGEKVDKNGPRRLEVLKTNLGDYPPALHLEFVRQDGTVHLKYSAFGEESSPDLSRLVQCKVWLELTLKKLKQAKPGHLLSLAEAEGFSRNTFYRARQELGGKIVLNGPKHDSTTSWVWHTTPPQEPPIQPPLLPSGDGNEN